jgi:hypothetical protein
MCPPFSRSVESAPLAHHISRVAMAHLCHPHAQGHSRSCVHLRKNNKGIIPLLHTSTQAHIHNSLTHSPTHIPILAHSHERTHARTHATRTPRYVGFYRPSYYSLMADPDLASTHGEDGQQSFPSGHASLSFSSMTTLTLYCLGKARALALGPGQLLKVLTCLSFMFLAWFVAASRVRDYRHHPADVNAGSMIGLLSAALAYHVYFLPVWHTECRYPRVAGSKVDINHLSPDMNATTTTRLVNRARETRSTDDTMIDIV